MATLAEILQRLRPRYEVGPYGTTYPPVIVPPQVRRWQDMWIGPDPNPPWGPSAPEPPAVLSDVVEPDKTKMSMLRRASQLATASPRRLAEIAKTFADSGKLAEVLREQQAQAEPTESPSDEYLPEGEPRVVESRTKDDDVSTETTDVSTDTVEARTKDDDVSSDTAEADRPVKTVAPPAGAEGRPSIIDILSQLDQGDDVAEARQRLAAVGLTPSQPYAPYKPGGFEMVAMLAPVLLGALSGNLGYGARVGAVAGRGFMAGDVARQQEERAGLRQFQQTLLSEADKAAARREARASRLATLYLTEMRNRITEMNVLDQMRSRAFNDAYKVAVLENREKALALQRQYNNERLAVEREKIAAQQEAARGRLDLAKNHEESLQKHWKRMEQHLDEMEKLARVRTARAGTSLPASIRAADEMRRRGYLRVGKDWVTPEDARSELTSAMEEYLALKKAQQDQPGTLGYTRYLKVKSRMEELTRALEGQMKQSKISSSSLLADDETADDALDDTEE